MTVNDDLLDIAIEHAVYLQRYSTGVVRRMMTLLNRADGDLVELIRKRLARIEDRGFDLGARTSDRLKALLEEIRKINAELYADLERRLGGELRELAAYEAAFQAERLQAAIPIPRLEIVRPALPTIAAAAVSRPFQGKLLREWLKEADAAKRARIRDAIRLGVVEGETIDAIVRRVRGTRALGYRDGAIEISRRHAEALVRTAVSHTVNYARERVYAENTSVISGIRWVSTIDGRTSAICRARDGVVYPVNKGPRPPAHVQCRSSTAPVTRSYRSLGIPLDEIPPGSRASMDGQIPEAETYGSWLAKKPRPFVEEILGKSKAKLFLDGKLPLDRYVDRAGNELTLGELRAREAEAFARAGL